MLDAHQLNVFLKASETLNFTRAAKQLDMTQPSVSQHIQSLENHFDMQLFLRTGKGLQLTEAGVALVPMAREMIHHSIHIDEAMASLQGEVFGDIAVGCSTTPGKYILPKFLARFHRQYPRVKVTSHVISQSQVLERLCERKIHFALAGFARKICQDLEMLKVFCDRVLLIVPESHPWSQQQVVHAKDLEKAKFIFREEGSGSYHNVRNALLDVEIDIDTLNTLMTLGNSEAIALAVKEGLGAGFVSQSVVKSMGREGISSVPVQGLDIQRDVYIARLKGRVNSKAQDVFWEFFTGKAYNGEKLSSAVHPLNSPGGA